MFCCWRLYRSSRRSSACFRWTRQTVCFSSWVTAASTAERSSVSAPSTTTPSSDHPVPTSWSATARPCLPRCRSPRSPWAVKRTDRIRRRRARWNQNNSSSCRHIVHRRLNSVYYAWFPSLSKDATHRTAIPPARRRQLRKNTSYNTVLIACGMPAARRWLPQALAFQLFLAAFMSTEWWKPRVTVTMLLSHKGRILRIDIISVRDPLESDWMTLSVQSVSSKLGSCRRNLSSVRDIEWSR